jgi:hypothetical protein
MEDTIERIVAFFRMRRRVSKSASRSSICSARSAAANHRLPSGSRLMEVHPIYVLAATN